MISCPFCFNKYKKLETYHKHLVKCPVKLELVGKKSKL